MTTAIARHINELEKEGGLNGTHIANFVSVSKATVSRWRSGTASPHPTNELLVSDLYYVVERLRDYYNRDEIKLWLLSPHPQLDGERAIDLIHSDRTKEVLEIIGRIDGEVYI